MTGRIIVRPDLPAPDPKRVKVLAPGDFGDIDRPHTGHWRQFGKCRQCGKRRSLTAQRICTPCQTDADYKRRGEAT